MIGAYGLGEVLTRLEGGMRPDDQRAAGGPIRTVLPTLADALRLRWALLRSTAIGILVGLGLTMAIPRGMSAILYGISPHDPGVLLGASAFFLLVATVAALIPAWRGARVDPRRALQID